MKVSIILAVISMICSGLSISFILWARHDEKKLEELRRLNDKSDDTDNSGRDNKETAAERKRAG